MCMKKSNLMFHYSMKRVVVQREIFLYICFWNGTMGQKEACAMKWTFSEEDIAKEIHKFYLEDDDLLMEGVTLEGEGKAYVVSGVATIDGERYHDFRVAFALLEEPAEQTPEAIMEQEWDWYDFLCE